jgi:exosortase/archaeosortase family protein
LLPVINAIRIAAIMVVGAFAPDLALTLFHSAVGSLLFLAVFLLYMRAVVPLVFGAAGSGPCRGRPPDA